MDSHIVSIVYQPAPSAFKEPYQFCRVPIDSATLIEKHGIEGDRKAGRNLNRQLNIMSRETLDQLAEQGWQTAPGQMGEQIVLAGFDVMDLPRGAIIQIGDTAQVELLGRRTPCSWLAAVQGKNHEAVENLVGRMAGVLVGGRIRVGDKVIILQNEKEMESR